MNHAAWRSTIVVAGGLDSDRDVHIVPCTCIEVAREHQTSIGCWCTPFRDLEEPLVVIHQRRAQA